MLKSQKVLLLVVLGILFLTVWLLIKNNSISPEQASRQINLPETISYNFHVKPILSDKCYTCHGPDANKRKAGLRIDNEKVAKAELKESPGKYAIFPGDAAKSELVKRIFSDDAKTMMPPPESHLMLSDEEKEILKKWIGQGAKYEKHWAFSAPEKSDLPMVKETSWAMNEIDYFILSAMEKRGFSPESQASNEKLVRRVSLDLTGLPPTLSEFEQFVGEQAIFDYDTMVDYFLSKKAYGERMTKDWLDVARYADSHGYQDDSYRTMWPWRDWVIHAFNQNIPYDQFLTWQIAGDLMPNANKEQLLATAFNRNHPITQEGGVIDEEYRSTYVTDRTNTLGKGILGITLECAKCHDHKYDPFSQKDYYSVYAFFNNVNEKGLQMDAVQAKNKKYYADAPYIKIEDTDLNGILSFINKTDTGNINVMPPSRSGASRSGSSGAASGSASGTWRAAPGAPSRAATPVTAPDTPTATSAAPTTPLRTRCGQDHREQYREPPQQRLGEQPGIHERGQPVGCHRPVTFRNAATMASGAGGQPGTCTSTSTKSSTDPATA